MNNQRWLSAAISDDYLVADLLLHLKECSTTVTTTAPSQSSPQLCMTPLFPTWGLRHPRSSVDKKRDAPHRSPTTPLSYASLTSPSDGACDSSSSYLSHRFRSKISTSSETPSTLSKRCKRKKTSSELKEEVSSLMKEPTHLKKLRHSTDSDSYTFESRCSEPFLDSTTRRGRELKVMHVSVKERELTKVSLKRMKHDLHQESRVKSEEATLSEPEEQTTNQSGGATSEAGSTSLSRQIKSEDASEPDSGSAKSGIIKSPQQPGFVLPDLNMMPDEDCPT